MKSALQPKPAVGNTFCKYSPLQKEQFLNH